MAGNTIDSEPDRRQSWPISFWYGIVCFLILAPVEVLIGTIGRWIYQPGADGVYVMTLVSRFADLAIIFCFMKRRGLGPRSLGADFQHWKRGIGYALLWLLPAFLAGFALYGRAMVDALNFESFRAAWVSGGLLGGFVSILLGPLVEEVVFRGWLYGALRNRFPAWLAIIVNALLFSAAHAPNPGAFLLTFGGGLLFAGSYETSRSLLTPLTLHVGGNLALKCLGPIFLI